jgi:hypothetical protein
MKATPQLIALIMEQDREALRMLEAIVPDGPRDAERLEQSIVAIRKRLGIVHEKVSA